MTEVARRRTRARIRLIKIQWLLILALVAALILSFVTRPSASVPDEPETSPVRVEAPEPITETSAPEPELIELGEFKTTAYCTCVKCCGIWSAEHPSRVGTDYVQRTKSGTIPTADRTVSVDPDVIPLGTVLIIDGHEYIAEDIRVCDQIANDTAVLFNTRYLGTVPNDAAGRIALWNDICKLHQDLESIRAIEDFDPDSVTVEQGDTKKAVLCTVKDLNVVNAMAQLYMSVIIM